MGKSSYLRKSNYRRAVINLAHQKIFLGWLKWLLGYQMPKLQLTQMAAIAA